MKHDSAAFVMAVYTDLPIRVSGRNFPSSASWQHCAGGSSVAVRGLGPDI